MPLQDGNAVAEPSCVPAVPTACSPWTVTQQDWEQTESPVALNQPRGSEEEKCGSKGREGYGAEVLGLPGTEEYQGPLFTLDIPRVTDPAAPEN